MASPPLILSIIHYTACSISLVFGSILLFLLLITTPSRLRAFVVLLKTQVYEPRNYANIAWFRLTIVELSTSLAAALVFPRIIPLGLNAAAGVINGPIKFITNDLSISWIFYTIELHGTLQYNVFMSVCYCYRYYVLHRKPPDVCETRIFAATVFLVSFALYVLFGMSRASPEELIIYINHYANEYDIDLRETFGVVNVLGSLATPAIVWTVLTACVLSVVNIFVGTAIYRYLEYRSEHISPINRAFHKQLFVISEIAIATSPVITLIFVKPYHRALLSFFYHQIKVDVSTTTRTTAL